jgi:type II secretory ATPase GspE/PulE/Tfp pilus assembly ATPase PilB-like protein
MFRLRYLLLAIVVLGVLSPNSAFAQSPRWPDMFGGDVAAMPRGEGFYLSWIKIAVLWLVFIAWAATADWINFDCQRHKLGYTIWNPVNVFPFPLALLASLLIPLYLVGLPLVILAYLAPALVYVVYRNARVEPHHKVLTLDHLRFLAAERLRPLGIKIEAQRKRSDELGPPIKLVAQGGAKPEDDNAHYFAARNSPGFLPAKELLWEAIGRRADTLMLDYTAQAVSIRYEIDGVWHNGESRDREAGDNLLVVLKTLASLNPAERRARQQGKFGIQYEKIKYACTLASQGTPTGERVVTQFDDGSAHFEKLPDLGMREKLVEQVKELLAQPQGFLLLSAPKRGGLTALTNATLGSSDRFTRSFMAVEDVQRPEKAIENIPVTTYDSKKEETPLSVLPRMVRLYPDVIVARDLIDGELVEYLCDQTQENRLVISTIRAKEAPEALLRVLMLKVPPSKFAPTAIGVVNQRLVRKLCETCREAYPPPPQLLAQLRIPQGKVEAFYRPPQAPEKVCPDCGGIGYRGRTGIFEVLVMNDHLRAVLQKTPKLDILRQEARKQGMRGLQEEGILLVAKGVTSLQELMRVLKE